MQYSVKCIDNLYLLFILSAFAGMIGISGGPTLIFVMCFAIALSVMREWKWEFLDCLILFFILYSIGTYFFYADYPFGLFLESLRDQIVPIFFYYIAKSKTFQQCRILQNMIYPLAVAYLIGLFLFFFPPNWYIAYKISGVDVWNVKIYYEFMRMSSFWTHPYFVGYSSLFVIIYILNQRVFNNVVRRYYNVILVVAFLALLFAQQRVSIAFAILYLVGLCVVAMRKGLIKFPTLFKYILSGLLVAVLLLYICNRYLEVDYIEYVLNRTIEKEDNMIDERVSLFDDYIETISFWGAGLGKYSHNALKYDMDSIADCEYIRVPNELGLFGIGVFLLIVIAAMRSLLKYRRLFCFEMLCIIFILIAMIGATPLERYTQQSFLFWFCIGRTQMKYYYDRC